MTKTYEQARKKAIELNARGATVHTIGKVLAQEFGMVSRLTDAEYSPTVVKRFIEVGNTTPKRKDVPLKGPIKTREPGQKIVKRTYKKRKTKSEAVNLIQLVSGSGISNNAKNKIVKILAECIVDEMS